MLTVLLHLHTLGSLVRLLLDLCILFAVGFSIVISPLTVLAFVAWIEYYIHEDGPAQETPKQVGQWAPLASIGFLVVSAGILKLKVWVAPRREIEWEIEQVLKHRLYSRQGSKRRQFLVSWKGYPSSENTWLNKTDLGNASELLDAYKLRHELRTLASINLSPTNSLSTHGA